MAELKVSDSFDILYEILGLLYTSNNYERVKSNLGKSLTSFGVSMEMMEKKYLKPAYKYIEVFNKNKNISDEDNNLYFSNDKIGMLLRLNLHLDSFRDLVHSIEYVEELKVRELLLDSYNRAFETEYEINNVSSIENIINMINNTEDMSSDTKWRLMIIFQEPKKYFIKLLNVVEDNIEAYKMAMKAIEKNLPSMIDQYKKGIENDSIALIKELYQIYSDQLKVRPTLSYFAEVDIKDGDIYCGLLCGVILKEKEKATGKRGDVLLKLKALGDKSKLEIMEHIKKRPMYSLELAETLQLSAATVSHHMTGLNNLELVNIEKKEGKVYYSINQETVKKFIDECSKMLL